MWLYDFSHGLYLHSWDILTILVLLCMVIMGFVHHRNQKKREKDFEEERQDRLDNDQENGGKEKRGEEL